MLKDYNSSLLRFAIFALVLLLTGCTNTNTALDSSDKPSSQLENYFPLNAGYTSIYSVTSAGITTQETFAISSHRQIGNADAVGWVVRDSKSNVDTSYLVLEDSALYFLETATADPEKILSLPLAVGTNWPRYYSYDVTGYNGDLGTGLGNDGGGFGGSLGGGNGKDTSSTNNGAAAKNYPSQGANTFTIVGIEQVNVSGMGQLSGALKISNIGYGGTVNYYWFVPELGLVKYMLGTNGDATATPQVLGEMINHS